MKSKSICHSRGTQAAQGSEMPICSLVHSQTLSAESTFAFPNGNHRRIAKQHGEYVQKDVATCMDKMEHHYKKASHQPKLLLSTVVKHGRHIHTLNSLS